MGVLIMILQLLCALCFLVAIHELGHLIAAKVFGMRVEKYSIGFPPRIFGFKKGGTDYSVGMIPLGGYVKISGMIDESLDKKQIEAQTAPQPWDFRAKPAWQRLIVMLGGIIVNIVAGVLIFISITLFIGGTAYYRAEEVEKQGVYATKIAQEIGIQTGDKITAINGKKYKKFSDIIDFKLLLQEGAFLTIERGGEEIEIPIPMNFVELIADIEEPFVSPLYPFEVGEVMENTEAERVGLKKGDKIMTLNGEPASFFQIFTEIKKKYQEQDISLKILRGNDTIRTSIHISQQGTIGFYPTFLLPIEKEKYSFFTSVSKGTSAAFSAVWIQGIALYKIIKGDIGLRKTISSPIGVAKVFGSTWNWYRFWLICGTLSMILAFMNLLPIPALDGGHVLFLLFEIFTGKSLPVYILVWAQKLGMLFLFALMAFAIGNDITKLFDF